MLRSYQGLKPFCCLGTIAAMSLAFTTEVEGQGRFRPLLPPQARVPGPIFQGVNTNPFVQPIVPNGLARFGVLAANVQTNPALFFTNSPRIFPGGNPFQVVPGINSTIQFSQSPGSQYNANVAANFLNSGFGRFGVGFNTFQGGNFFYNFNGSNLNSYRTAMPFGNYGANSYGGGSYGGNSYGGGSYGGGGYGGSSSGGQNSYSNPNMASYSGYPSPTYGALNSVGSSGLNDASVPVNQTTATFLQALGVPNTKGQIQWPLGLRVLSPGGETQHLRQQLDVLAQVLANQATHGQVSPQVLKEATRSVNKLRQLLRVSEEQKGMVLFTYNEATQFLDHLTNGLETLSPPSGY